MMLRAKRRRFGSAVVEVTLLAPWYFFLFVGAFDWGYYSHALISVESATRTAALYASGQSSAPSVTALCSYVLNELEVVPNVNTSLDCTSSPVVVSISTVTGIDGTPGAYQVSVAYTTLQLIPIPGLLTSKTTITRTLQVRPRV
jgi:Flp pilus assembly protein TadG